MVLCATVIYWLVRQLQAVIADHKELRRYHHDSLVQVIQSQNETSIKLAVHLDRNIELLKKFPVRMR